MDSLPRNNVKNNARNAARAVPKTELVNPELIQNVSGIPRQLVENTLQVLLTLPAAQVYLLINQWEALVPGILVRNPGQ